MGQRTKLTDEQFFSVLRESAGIFSRTARAIEKQFGVTYSRQAVHERAHKHPEVLADIREQNIDIAEEGLQSLIRSTDERVRMQAVKYLLSTLGKPRGYIERTEQDLYSGGKPLQVNVVNYDHNNSAQLQSTPVSDTTTEST